MSTDLIQNAVSQTDIVGFQPAVMSIENPSMDLNDPATYDLLTGGAESHSGVRVNESKALTHPAVWQAINLISGDIASLPLEVFRLEPDGDRIPLSRDPLYELVHWQTNSEMTAFKFWKRMLSWRLLWNNAYAYIFRNGNGTARSMVPLLPDRTSFERHEGRLWVITEVDGELIPLHPENVFHLEGLSIDGMEGFEFIKAARQAVGLGLAELNFVSKFYKNGGRMGGILELPASMPKKARDNVETGFKKKYSTDDAFQVVILRENAKFHAGQVTPEAAQVIDGRRESVRDIARLFNTRPGKLGEESKNSFASKAEDNKDHHDTTLRPHTKDIVQECRSKLLTPEQKKRGLYFEHNTREFLRMDFKSMSEALASLRAAGILNSNESRGLLNINKRKDAGGEDYNNPNTTSNASPSQRDEQSVNAAFRLLLSGTVKRMAMFVANRAKKLAANPKEFLAWIDEGYEGQRESLTDAISELISATAGVVKVDVEDATKSIVDDFMRESLQILQTVASSTEAKSLRDVVAANVNEWAEEAGDRYASQLFG